MTKKSRGFRHATRKKLRQTGRPSITKFLQEFKMGQNVVISIEPSSHKGMPFARFKGKVGRVIENRGNSYVIEIRDGNMTKQVISKPEHLKPL